MHYCRGISNKLQSVTDIFEAQGVDIAMCSELNISTRPPKIKGFSSFHRKSSTKFHGLALYTRDFIKESVLRIPEEDPEFEIIHVLLTNTVPALNVIGVYTWMSRVDRTERH